MISFQCKQLHTSILIHSKKHFSACLLYRDFYIGFDFPVLLNRASFFFFFFFFFFLYVYFFSQNLPKQAFHG